jgi:hypothetical protein
MVVMAVLAYELVGNCFVLAVSKESPGDDEWNAYITFVQSHLKKGMLPVALIASAGGGPTAAQRARLNDMTKKAGLVNTLKAAVLTDSLLVRGMATALAWIVPGYRAFPPAEIGAALEFLGVSGAASAQVKLLVPKLQDKLK